MASESLTTIHGGEQREVGQKTVALNDISDRFHIRDSVKHLQSLMTDVTKKEQTADTVNAACNCVSQINSTIKTAIAAAKYLSEG